MPLAGAASWALARLLKVLLKRNLKHIFRTEIDVDQLEVAGGAVALRELVLSLEWLNLQLAGSGWEATAGFVGSVHLRLPLAALTSLACQVEVEDVLLTLRPCGAVEVAADAAPRRDGAGGGAAVHAGQDEGSWGDGQQEATVAEGIRVVAAGLEAMLQRLRVQVSRLVVRLEVPAAARGRSEGQEGGGGWHAITLQLEELRYGGPSAGGPGGGGEEGEGRAEPPLECGDGLCVRKAVAFSGLGLNLQPAPSLQQQRGKGAQQEELPPLLSGGQGGGAGGAGGCVDVSVAWQPGGHRSIELAVSLEPLHLQLWPAHLAAAVSVLASLRDLPPSRAAGAEAREWGRQPQPAPRPPPPRAETEWGTRSLLDSLLLPDCERAVGDAIVSGQASWQEEVDEFFDAKSLLGSLQSTLSDFGLAASGVYQAHALAVSVHHAPAPPRSCWTLRLAAPELSAAALYPAAAGQLFHPQLVLEVSQVEVEARRSGDAGGGLEVQACLAQLEVSEHLPYPRAPPGGGGGGELPEQMGRVPGVLPRLRRGRAVPGAAGDYPLPGAGSAAASVAAATLASTVFQTALAESGVVPRVQIIPVLACGQATTSSGGGGLCLLATARGAAAAAGAAPALGLAALLPPITLWLAPSLAERAQALAAEVLALLPRAAQQGGARQQQQEAAAAGGRQQWQAAPPAVAAARPRRSSIDEVLQELQELNRDLAAPPPPGPGLEFRLFAPSVTLIAGLPQAGGGGAQQAEAGSRDGGGDGGGGAPAPAFSYVAIDLVGDERLPLSGQRRGLGGGGAREALALLEEERVPPLACIRQQRAGQRQAEGYAPQAGAYRQAGGHAQAQAPGAAAWTCCVVACSGAAYVVGTMQPPADVQESAALDGMYAETLARAGGGGGGGGTFTIEAAWAAGRRPTPARSLEAAWGQLQQCAGGGGAGGDPGGGSTGSLTAAELDVMALRDACFRDSALSVTVRSPSVGCHLSQATAAALVQLSDALLQMAPAAPAAPDGALQTSLLLECSLDCHLAPVGGDGLAVVAAGVQCFACSSLAGRPGSSVLALSADVVRVGTDEQSMLSGAGSHGTPALEVVRLSRPTGAPYVANRRLLVPSEAQTSLTLTACTLAADAEGFGMAWLATLAQFFTAPQEGAAAAPSSSDSAAGAAGGGGGAEGVRGASAAAGLCLRLRQVALHRGAPAPGPRRGRQRGGRGAAPAVPVALLVGDLSLRQEGAGQELLLSDLSVHVAEPPPATGDAPRQQQQQQQQQQPASLASLDLLAAAGYSRVLSEASARVVITPAEGAAGEPRSSAGCAPRLMEDAAGGDAGGGARGPCAWADGEEPEASVLLEGDWIDPLPGGALTPPDSPPTLVEAPDEADGVWLGAGAPALHDSYIPTPRDDAPRHAGRGAPTVLRLRVLRATLTLADTFTTILLPGDGDEGGAGGAAEAVESVPAASEVQLTVDGLSACLAAFAPAEAAAGGGGAAGARGAGRGRRAEGEGGRLARGREEGGQPRRLRRVAVVVRDLEMRDSVQAIGSNKPRAWRRMLGYHASATVPRDVDACLFSLSVDTTAAADNTTGEEQHAVAVALLPLKLALDQRAVAFLQAFADALAPTGGGDQGWSPARGAASSPARIERMEISPFTLTLDYKPRQIDVAALARGHFVEALNLVPFGGVSLCFRHMRVYGMDAHAAAAAVVSAYLGDIVQHQAHKFVQAGDACNMHGVAPIRSLANIGASTRQLLAIPAEVLFSRQAVEGGGARTLLSQLSDANFQLSLRRGLANLARQVAIEAMNLTATAGGAAASALDSQTYRAAREQPADLRAAVAAARRQVGSGLRSGSVAAAAAAAVGATRTLSLGARNALNPDHFLERQMNL
eukprot:scaffold4.g4811.t1